MPDQDIQKRHSGILPDHLLQEAVKNNIIHSEFTIPLNSYQPASLDLRLGETAYSLQCSFLPHHSEPVETRLSQLTIAEIDIRDGAVLERNRPYLIPLLENLDLPPDLTAKTNPKSSTGRLDIFTRVITNNNQRFDTIPAGYRGPMYIEVFSRSFTIRVERRLSLNQLRLFRGDPSCKPGEILELHQQTPVAFPQASAPERDNTLSLTIDLESPHRPPGYRAKKNSALLDLSLRSHYRARDFWEPVFSSDDKTVILEPEEFYLFSAAESVSIPPMYAAEMNAYQTSIGELRTHYAGFFDPGFGYGPQNAGRVRPAMEIRAHDVPFMTGPGQTVCTLTFERMLEHPHSVYGADLGSTYQDPDRVLSKHFEQLTAPTQG